MKIRRRNWLLAILSAASLAACSPDPDLPPPPIATPVTPEPNKAIAAAHAAAAAEKLIDPIEVSEVRQGKSLGPGDYMLCIRGARSPTDPRLTYAVFFYDGTFRDSRPSVFLDECETQTYTRLAPARLVPANGTTPETVSSPAPEPANHGKHH